MTRSIWWVLFVVSGLMGCGSRAPIVETREAESVRAPGAPTVSQPPATPGGVGVCRAFGRPADFDAKGREIAGAFPGELPGPIIGAPMDYMTALRTCVDEPSCVGLTSDWYIGAPWTARKAGERAFQSDDGSYGCTVLVSEPR